MDTMSTDVPTGSCRVVISYKDGRVVRGYSSSRTQSEIDLSDPQYNLEKLLATCVREDGSEVEGDASRLKAIFFVSTFKGDREYQPVRFYSDGPTPKLIWVEIGFEDGELVEGCVQNSIHHLRNDGFFLLPSSPGSNNLLIYVNKAAVTKYRVLGVRI